MPMHTARATSAFAVTAGRVDRRPDAEPVAAPSRLYGLITGTVAREYAECVRDRDAPRDTLYFLAESHRAQKIAHPSVRGDHGQRNAAGLQAFVQFGQHPRSGEIHHGRGGQIANNASNDAAPGRVKSCEERWSGRGRR